MRRSVIAAALLPCALALASCSSSSNSGSGIPIKAAATGTSATVGTDHTGAAGVSNTGLTQSQLEARVSAAAATATAIHVTGTLVDDGQSMSLDLQINKDDSAQGTVSESGMVIPVIATTTTTYFQLTSSLITMMSAQMASGGSGSAALLSSLTGKWIASTSSAGASLHNDLAGIMNFGQMTSQFSGGSSGADGSVATFTYIGTGVVDGQQVAQYRDVSSDKSTPTTIMSVPLTGPALPIEISAGSQGSIALVWNQPTTVTPPPANEIATIPGQ